MKKNIFVSVSTDPIKDYEEIIRYAKFMQGKADFLHCDIMDGKLVPNKTYDASLVSNINQNSLIMLDVHLMCEEPKQSIDEYIKAGANIITIHYEAFKNKEEIVECISKIKKAGLLAGLSFKPQTPIKDIKIFAHDVDIFLVMSVEPGLSGQKFMPMALDKLQQLDNIRRENGYNYKIEVDGGINADNIKDVIASGADIIVSGSFIYKAEDKIKAISLLKG